MIQFDRIETDRVYLGFTQAELDWILDVLVEHEPDEELTKRIDVLAMAFHQRRVEAKGRRDENKRI